MTKKKVRKEEREKKKRQIEKEKKERKNTKKERKKKKKRKENIDNWPLRFIDFSSISTPMTSEVVFKIFSPFFESTKIRNSSKRRPLKNANTK